MSRSDQQYWLKPKRAKSTARAWWYANERGSIEVYQDGQRAPITITALALREFLNYLDRHRASEPRV